MHIAVKKGYKLVVEELLKYKADTEVINNIGYRPIHNSWLFWQKKKDVLTGHHRTKEERIAQEEATCDILLSLLSFGAYVDAPDIKVMFIIIIIIIITTNKHYNYYTYYFLLVLLLSSI